jgi:hypothetical protein
MKSTSIFSCHLEGLEYCLPLLDAASGPSGVPRFSLAREAPVAEDDRTVSVPIPISIRRRSGRKLVLAPDGTDVPTATVCRRVDNAMVKAIARAFRWREMLETGTYATIAEIAAAEKINARGSRPAAHAASAGHRRGNPGWTAAGGDDPGGVDAAV